MGVKSTAAPPKNLDFRKDINGLLAFAVLFVVFFHFGVPGFDGGFVLSALMPSS